MSTHISQLLEKNRKYATTHEPIPFFDEFPEGSKTPDTIIYACVDMRVDPAAILGLQPGVLLGLKEVLLIKHTDCGATHLTEDQVHDGLKKIAPDHGPEIDKMVFGTFTDVPGAAIESVKFVKEHPLVRKELKDNTTGAVYDIKTGLITKVDA